MQPADFNAVVEDLVNTFGVTRWPATRIAILWKLVGNLDVAWFRKTADRVIGSMDFGFDWMKAASSERSRLWDEQRSREITTRDFQFSDKKLTDIIASADAKTREVYAKLTKTAPARDRHDEIEKLKLTPLKKAEKEEPSGN